MRTRGTSPQLHARIGGRVKRRRPNLWTYGWSLLVIGLETKQAQAFNNWGFFRVSLCIFIVSYLSTFSDYCKTFFENYLKKVCFLSLVPTPVLLVLTPRIYLFVLLLVWLSYIRAASILMK